MRILILSLRKLQPLLCHHSWETSTAALCHQQLRHKSQRYKAPPVAKEKVRSVGKLKRVKTLQEMMSPKEYEEFMSRVPQDDVWLRSYYPAQQYSFEEVMKRHRQLAAPEMMNNMNGVVKLEAELDMSTQKKTKFISIIQGTVLYPHIFYESVNRVAAICKTPEDQEKAKNAGAVFVGGLDLIRKIEKDDIGLDEFDRVVCTRDSLLELSLIRKHLKDRYPSKKAGNLGDDIESMVRIFTHGLSYDSVKDTDAVHRLSVAFGRLNFTDSELLDNLNVLVANLSSVKAANLKPLISSAGVICPPSPEKFMLQNQCIHVQGSVRSEAQTSKAEEEADEKDADELDDIDEDIRAMK